MVATGVADRVRQADVASVRLSSKFASQVEGILGEDERSNAKAQPKPMRMFYTVPLAGVRYYSFAVRDDE